VATIKAMNDLRTERIMAGQVLSVPSP
jgi:LysM repeat protein